MSFTEILTFTVVHCCRCSVPFGMTKALNARRLNDGKDFYCPNGHPQVYSESNLQKLEKELARKEDDLKYYRGRNDQLYNEKEAVKRRLSATKGQVTKIKNRVSKGVCPCCNRTFENLACHMQNQHPEFAEKSEI